MMFYQIIQTVYYGISIPRRKLMVQKQKLFSKYKSDKSSWYRCFSQSYATFSEIFANPTNSDEHRKTNTKKDNIFLGLIMVWGLACRGARDSVRKLIPVPLISAALSVCCTNKQQTCQARRTAFITPPGLHDHVLSSLKAV